MNVEHIATALIYALEIKSAVDHLTKSSEWLEVLNGYDDLSDDIKKIISDISEDNTNISKFVRNIGQKIEILSELF